MNLSKVEGYAERAKAAILSYKIKDAKALAEEVVADKNSDILDIINNGFVAGINEIGRLYAERKVFLPHIINAANVFTVAFDILCPEIQSRGGELGKSLGNVVICTVEGDIHTIGKDIVASMLKIAGFTVYNLGRDVSPDRIVTKSLELKADVVATSALMTSTALVQKNVEEALRKAGIRDKVKTNIGGAATTEQWAKEIGADSYSENSNDAVSKIKATLA